MNQKDFQLYLDVTIDVLSQKNLKAIDTLKNFLRSSPSPKDTEQILLAGILYFAKHDTATFTWLIDQQDHLRPEINILISTQKLVTDRLIHQGWVHGRDFQMEDSKTLMINRKSAVDLSECCSQHELLLIQTTLKIMR